MATRRRKRWKSAIFTATLTAVPFTVFTSTASAFFPPVINLPPPVVVVPPVVVPPVVVPPVVPPIVVPPVVPPVCPPPVVSPPTTVPEPATLVTALIGMGAAAGYRALRGKKNAGESVEGKEPA